MKLIQKITILIIIMLSISPSLFAHDNDNLSGQGQTHVQAIRERGYIIVAMIETEQYPFFYTDSSGNFTGLDVDISKEVARRLGVDLVFNREAQAFNDLIPLVVDKKVDFAASKLSQTIERSKLVMYTEPYIVFKQALLVNRLMLAKTGVSNSKLKSFFKEFSLSIGVISNSSYERYASINFPNATLFPYDTWDQVIDAGLKGEVFTIYRDELEIFKVIKANPQYNLTMKPVVLSDQTDPIAIAVHPTHIHLVYYLDQVLKNMDFEISTQNLLERYER